MPLYEFKTLKTANTNRSKRFGSLKKRRRQVFVQKQEHEAAVGASQDSESRDSEDPPFGDESQENQLPTLRAASRKEVRLKPGPAVGGKSAVGDGGIQRHWKIV